jgi:ABC-2 type transport system permease protein
MLVLLFGAMYGNEPMAQLGGRGSMDISMPGYTAMILGTVGFMNVPIAITAYREMGVLRRFRATPLRPLAYILADVASNLCLTMLGMVGLLAVGKLRYNVRFEGQILPLVTAVVFGGLAMFAIGYVIGSVVPGARPAQVVGMVIFYPMLFLSGASIPLEVMPAGIQRFATFLPLTYVVRLLRGMWFGEAWRAHLQETVVLGVVLVFCAAVAARVFRWE